MKVWGLYVKDLSGNLFLLSLWERKEQAEYAMSKIVDWECSYIVLEHQVNTISLFDEDYDKWQLNSRG